MAAANKLNQLAADIAAEVEAQRAELTALETKIRALCQTEAELTARIGNHMRNVQLAKRIEVLQAACRKFAESEA